MKLCINFFLHAIICIATSSSFAQKQYNVWYFGYDGAGLDFNSGAPVALNSAMGFTEGCATYCNSVGKLLFYTNGDTLWNKNHQVMPNGVGLGGPLSVLSSKQNSVIIPIENDTNKYYLFSNGGVATAGGMGLHYSLIDMTLNGGLGDVVTSAKAINLLGATAEKVTAVKHANGCDYWVITTLHGSNSYYAYRVSPCGGVIDTVITSIGPIDLDGFGNLKASPLSNKLATTVNLFLSGGAVVLFDFDNATGILSNAAVIDSTTAGMALSFSPNGQIFYLGSGQTFPQQLYQFDLTAVSITLSKTLIGNLSGSPTGFEFPVDIQIGPDGKLYVCFIEPFFTLGTLDAINFPNVLGTGCALQLGAANLGGRYGWLDLPNNITSFLLDTISTCAANLTANFTSSSFCLGSLTAFTNTSNSTAASWSWNFGDPTSAPSDTSSLQNPSHLYSSAGTYTVTLIAWNVCQADTVTQTITVTPLPLANAGPNTTICSGTSVTLNATGGTNYTWSNGQSTASISVTPSATTTYSVIVSVGSCSDTASVTVSVTPTPAAVVSGNATICSGSSTVLTASGGGNYTWNTGSTTAAINVSPSATTTYSVVVSVGSCADTATTTVTIAPSPTITVTGNTTICQGDTTTLTAFGGTNYGWSTGAITSSITVSPASSSGYTVTASNPNGCSQTQTVTVSTIGLTATITAIPVIITWGGNSQLSAAGGGTYQWTPTTGLSCTTCANPIATPSVTTNYCVVVINANGCTDSACVTINVDMPDSSDLFIPNVFSPNGDGTNDVFAIKAYGFKNYHLEIFDRWGVRLFETTYQKNYWDGHAANGLAAPQGTYFYILKLTDNKEKQNTYKGFLTLLR